MPGFTLRKNMAFDWDGTTFRIDRLQPNGDILLERVKDCQLTLVTRDRLLAEYAQGKVSARIAESLPAHIAVPVFSRPLDELPERVRNEALRRRRYIDAIHADGAPVFTKRYLAPLIKQVAAEFNDKKPPSVSSLIRWNDRFRTTRDTRALIPRTDLRGRRASRQSERVLELAAEAIEEALKTSPQATGTNIYSRLLAKIKTENARRLPDQPLLAPNIRTLYRILERTDAYEKVCLREGKAAADKRFRVGKAATRVLRILERVEMDHTPLDLFLIDEKTWLPLGRPTLTIAMDRYSRMLLGYYLSFGSPSTAAVMGALRHAILPKTLSKAAMPGLPIEHAWPCYGLPAQIVVDNGMEFHSDDLDSVAYDLGIHIQFCPKHQPRFKGAVERFLGTINYNFAHQLPGTSFARFYQRGDYDPQKCALLTFAEFKHIFEKWVVDVYAQTVHRGLGTTPWARWHEGLAKHEPELPEDLRLLQRRIGLVKTRCLRRDGIQLNGIRYSGDALQPILSAYGEGVQVRVSYDAEDLGEIQVWGPDDTDPVAVLALDQSYARGLTLRQNETIRDLLREQGASAEDPAALQRARSELSQSISALMVSRKQTARRRGAALKGFSSNLPTGTVVPSVSPPKPRPAAKPRSAQADAVKDAPPQPLETFQLKRHNGRVF
ncbi:MAG TPA: transposase family protein [Thiobacillus sp.]|nr:MAG: integrase [Hydrogenophilales bacterium 28-61-11]OYZ58544.1 MAG: integrase [Hydrogenophilales bacterium 16-61-112]OZA50431.1 MAG: integrase [Hydrogenophilales bacterium 17-61-76]HQT29611.1 transposase family protein [Thiobacillus sp.]HQT70253.1 transposase family protein [Thiobacillus sp.]